VTLSQNIASIEVYLRVILAVLLIAMASHGNWWLLPVGIALLATGLLRYCPFYGAAGVNRAAARRQFFLSHIPQLNPEPVLLFDAAGNRTYANDVALDTLPRITHSSVIADIRKEEFDQIREQGTRLTHKYSYQKKTYLFLLQGCPEIDSIIGFGFDISEAVRADQEIINTQKEVLLAMGGIGEIRSRETANHVKRVAAYSKLLALQTGMSEEEAELLKMASPMHDIGKVGIPDAILNKPGRLTDEEFSLMQTHAELGYEMLKHSRRPILQAAATVAHQHHERWDGSGYPNGLKGEQIHLFGRITAVTDVFDALASDRVYKKAWPMEQIIELFQQERGAHFEPRLVDILLQNMDGILEIRRHHPD